MSIALSVWQHGAELAGWLDRGMLFTAAAEQWGGETVHTSITERIGRDILTPDEHHRLETWLDDTQWGCRREGVIRTASGRDVARVSAVYLPGRIGDPDVIERLQCDDVPLGRALFPLGVRRITLDNRTLACGWCAVEASGVLKLPGGLPVALAREQVFREFAVRE